MSRAPSYLSDASIAYARAARLGTPDQIAKARTAFEEAKVRAWTERTLALAPNLSKRTVATLNRLLTIVGEK
jgi:hypothetical protein